MTRWLRTAAGGALVLTALVWSAASPAAPPQGSVGIDKSVVGLSGAATPGAGFSYQLTAQCSSLTVACVGATVTDVLPPDLVVIPSELPTSNASQRVSYDAATRTLKVTFTEPLPPPNPPGSTGLPAGSVRQVLVGVKLPEDTRVPDGSTISNTGTITADNASPASSLVDVPVSIPRVVKPVATKSWPDSSPVALTGARSRITLGIANASSSSAKVTELSVRDANRDTFEDFDLVSVGPVDRFPAGADRVAVAVCRRPIDSPCAPGQYERGPFGPGRGVDLPPGVSAGEVTGVQFVFRNGAGQTLPADPTEGRVSFEVKLRDTVRSTGEPLDPKTTHTGRNCADPVAVESGSEVVGTPACVGYSVLPNAATVKVDKSFFADANGSYSPNGVVVAGYALGASALTKARNTSPFGVSELTIVDPSRTATSRFSDFDADSLRIEFPDGATDATITIECRDGTSHEIGPLHPPPTTVQRSTDCPGGSFPSRVTVRFTAGGAAGIRSGATASLGLHGAVKRDVAPGRVSDCADGTIPGESGHGAATGTACAEVTVEAPRSTEAGNKSINGGLTGGQLVPGQPLSFTVNASNSGNLPQSEFLVQDPADPTAANNPFDLVRLTDASFSTSPAGLRGDMVIELFDPATGGWVAYDPANPGLLDAAHGIRVRLVRGTVAPGSSVSLGFSVLVRDGIPIGTSLQNCQRTSARTAAGAGSSDTCAPRLEVQAPAAGGAVQKTIAPATVARHLPGVPPQSAQVRLQAQNTGTIPLRRIVVTDTDAAFFDSVDLTRIDAVNFPPGADRVQVDACTTGCASGTFIDGTPTASTRPVLPAGVWATDVQGLRFTFTNSSGGYVLTPGANFPSGGPCPHASICFSVAPRVTLRSDPATEIPGSLSDTASAAGESQLQPPGTTFPIGDSTAPLSVVKGTSQLSVDKSTDTPVAGPGEPIPFTLTVSNSGTGAIPDLTISEPVPSGLVFDQSFVGTDNQPFTIASTVPAGTPALPKPTFTPERDPSDPSRIALLRWSFPGFTFLPGSTVKIGFRTTFAPGLESGERVENSFGASSSDEATRAVLACDPASGAATDRSYGSGRYCTAKASVTSRGGSALDAQKWVTGDPALGFYNTATDTYVKPGEISCPLLRFEGADYTRYPCIALVLAGQHFRFLLDVVNVGSTPATEVRLVDGLPHIGDTGVKLVDEPRDTQWEPRPHLAAEPALVAVGSARARADFSYTNQEKPCTADLQTPPRSCPAGDWHAAFSTDALGFRSFVTFPDRLRPGQGFAVSVPMSAPVNLEHPANGLPIAWNSFAHTDFVLKPGETKSSQLPVVEPPKVGVALPFGTLEIAKEKTGPLAATAAGPFAASYDCTVTPAGGEPVGVRSGEGEFNVGQPLVEDEVPVGATCRVWETDTGGGESEHTLPDDAITTVIHAQRNGSTVVTLANDFPEPPPPPPSPPIPGDAQLVLSKRADLTAAKVGEPLNYTIEVVNAGPAAATDVRVSDQFSAAVTGVATSVSQGSCTTGPPVECSLGTLPADGRATLTIQAVGMVPGSLENTATATGHEPNPTPSKATAKVAIELTPAPVREARLRITKVPAHATVRAPAEVTYGISVQALESVTAINVRVCDRLSSYVTLVSSSPRGHLTGGEICWTIPTLAPRQPRMFKVTVLAPNVPRRLIARDTAAASARNARAVHARASLVIKPPRRPPSFTG